MKKIMSLILVGVMLFNLAGCGGSGKEETTKATETQTAVEESAKAAAEPVGGEILIGCVQDITGATSSLGQMVEAGAKWAVDEINEAGGVDGKKLVLITYDTKGDVTEAVNAFTKAVSVDKVSLVVGPPVANIALAIKETAEQYDVPVMHLAIDKNACLKEDGTPYRNMFMFQPSADQQASIAAKYALKNGFKTFGVIYNESNAYSISLKDPFISTVLEEGGICDESLQVAYNANDTDFKTLLAPIVEANVDAIFVPNYVKDLINIITAARALGYEGAFVCGLDACPPFNTMMGADCTNIYYTNNIDDTADSFKDVIAAVKEQEGIDATNKFFLGYDIICVAAKCMEEVGTEDPEALRTAIENVTNFDGMTGNITIDPATHMTKGLEMFMFTYDGTTPIMLERYGLDE